MERLSCCYLIKISGFLADGVTLWSSLGALHDLYTCVWSCRLSPMGTKRVVIGLRASRHTVRLNWRETQTSCDSRVAKRVVQHTKNAKIKSFGLERNVLFSTYRSRLAEKSSNLALTSLTYSGAFPVSFPVVEISTTFTFQNTKASNWPRCRERKMMLDLD